MSFKGLNSSLRYISAMKWNVNYQLVPPHIHRRNVAERAIQTFKAHFLSVLAGVAVDFPRNLWDLLIPQTELTLNLLRQSNSTPEISAWEAFDGAFSYNHTPLAHWDAVSSFIRNLEHGTLGISEERTDGESECQQSTTGASGWWQKPQKRSKFRILLNFATSISPNQPSHLMIVSSTVCKILREP